MSQPINTQAMKTLYSSAKEDGLFLVVCLHHGVMDSGACETALPPQLVTYAEKNSETNLAAYLMNEGLPEWHYVQTCIAILYNRGVQFAAGDIFLFTLSEDLQISKIDEAQLNKLVDNCSDLGKITTNKKVFKAVKMTIKKSVQ